MKADAEPRDGADDDSVPAEVRAFRAEYRRSQIGPHYRGWLHFTFTTIGALSVITFAAAHVRGATFGEWLSVPISFLIANFAEYAGHKGPMHRPRAGLHILFERHTRQHHQFFTHDAMAYRSSRDFKMVLFPPVMLFFFLGVLQVPIALVLGFLTTSNVAWLFVATGMGYFLTYEWLHFAYHLDESSKVGGHPLLRKLRLHHQAHHDKALMGKWNFNITFPICDRIFGTSYSAPANASRGDERWGGRPSPRH